MNRIVWLVVFLVGCAGFQRDCKSSCASAYGSDWIVVQYRFDGAPINCWKLKDTAITNEGETDGIFWASPDGHLVHISGWYNRAQVNGGNWEGAARQLDVNLDACTEGAYRPKVQDAGGQ